MSFEAVKKGSLQHPKPDHKFTYGTAGFRMNANLLDSVMYRTGLLAVLRSKKLDGRIVGVMVTASHNPVKDNGVKLVEPLGEMLSQEWESYAIELANASSEDHLVEVIESIIAKESIDFGKPARVLVARDTRPSGEPLLASLSHGVEALGGQVIDHGVKTTPQLHYLTRCLNTAGTSESYGEPTEDGYYQKLAVAFKKIVAGKKPLSTLTVDCANGVGAPALAKLIQVIGADSIKATLVKDNITDFEQLNNGCGADYVKLYQKAPLNLELPHGQRSCSLDGDADRIVFYFADANGNFKLLDGDKIATLAANFIMSLIRKAELKLDNGAELQVGVVQTAYANGSSSSYIKDILQVPVVFTCTGVKHLHHAAEHFDVGVYFEANGHGTVLFSKAAINAFHSAKSSNPEKQAAIDSLCALSDLINQTVGDALSDLLMVEAILTAQGLTFEQWDAAYTDLPSRQEKVKVKDRNLFVPINADTELAQPEGLQPKINQIVAKFSKGRSFVRPSGTEDVVRVYAEAATREETETLSNTICGIVFDYYGGVGERPSKFIKS